MKLKDEYASFDHLIEDSDIPAEILESAATTETSNQPTLENADGRTEVANGRRLASKFGHKIRYVHAWRCWLVYDGRRWKRDSAGALDAMAKCIGGRSLA